jgi:hypothetical protein
MAPQTAWFRIAGIWAVLCGLVAISGFFSSHPFMECLIVASITMAYGLAPLAILLLAKAIGRRRSPPTRQVQLYAEGYGQRRGFGTVGLMRWYKNIEIIVKREAEGVYQLRLDRFGPAGHEDWAARVRLFFLADAATAAAIEAQIKQWQRDAGDLNL